MHTLYESGTIVPITSFLHGQIGHGPPVLALISHGQRGHKGHC